MASKKEQLDIILKAKDQYSQAVDKMESRFKLSAKSLAMIGTAVTATTVALGKIINDTAEAGDRFQKMALRTGFAVETLSEFAHVAELSGTSLETMETGFRRLSKNMNDADVGLLTAQRTFQELGIRVTDTNGDLRDSEAVFNEALIKLSEMTDETKRAALAQDLFGRSGTAMLPIVKAGAEGIAEMRQEARDLGIVFDQESADAAAEFEDNMLRMQRVATGFTRYVGITMIPVFNRLFDLFKAPADPGLGLSIEDIKVKLGGLRTQQMLLQRSIGPGVPWAEAAEKGRKVSALTTEIEKLENALAKLIETEKADEAAAEKGKIQLLLETQDAEMGAILGHYEALKEAKLNYLEWDTAVMQNHYDVGLQSLDHIFSMEGEMASARLAEQTKMEKITSAMRINFAQNTASSLVNILDALNTLSQGKHKSQFEALKVARIAQATINTYAGATAAFTDTPGNIWIRSAAAAAAITLGLAQVAAISQTQFGGGAPGGSVGMTSLPSTGPDTGPPPGTEEADLPPQQITLIISDLFGEGDVDQITETVIIPAIERAGDRDVTLEIKGNGN